MVYTVKKLSEISGVTVRTLHFYEEEGLLKPAYYASNGYRYYEEKELLQLQQILFFRELGLTLKQIRNVVQSAHGLFEELVNCIENGLAPADSEVQKIMKRHHAFMAKTHAATKEVYQAYAQLYVEHPEFRKQLDPFHPKLAAFMADAMRVFADQKLS